MIWALLITAAVVLLSGLASRYVIPRILQDPYWQISWREFIFGALAALLVAMPAVFAAGIAWSTADALRYEEFYNGVETSATVQVTDCAPGYDGGSESSGHSNCHHEYLTGETYTFTEYYPETTCDDDGECTTEMKSRLATGYIYNPYAAKEYAYAITDSLGGSYSFPYAYVKDGEGYGGSAIPEDIPRGDPQEWTESKTRLDEGNPRPVTRLFDYDNYILASGDDMLTPYSKDVERYKEEEILPDHTANIMAGPLYGTNASFADKVSFVGVEVANEAAWQDALMSFNAALGSKYRGDMHLVIIDASLVDSPTNYLNALKAYWLGDDFGRRAIAKNAIIVVAGVRGDTVEWGIASTGMPFGNEVMLQGIEDFLPDTPLDPEQVIGAPRTVVTPATDDGDDVVQVTLSESPGVLERVVLQDFPFQRACMECTEEDGEIGYADLVVSVEPETWQWSIMIVIVSILSFVWWFFAGANEFFNWTKRSKETQSDGSEYDPYAPSAYEPAYDRVSKRKRRRRDSFYEN